MVFEKLCGLIAEQFAVDESTITMETSFADDLGADSLDIVELTMAMEEAFNISETNEEELAEMKTVGDVVRYISNIVDQFYMRDQIFYAGGIISARILIKKHNETWQDSGFALNKAGNYYGKTGKQTWI